MKIQNRPKSLAEVALRSESEQAFGRELADFEHELLRCSSRKELSVAIQEEPPRVAQGFSTGGIADAWLAAYAEALAAHFGLNYPDWIWGEDRQLEEPFIYDAHNSRLKVWHILKAPPSFSRRNLFVDFHLPAIQLRRGRPRKSTAHKREMNRRRVAKHRAKEDLNLLPRVHYRDTGGCKVGDISCGDA